MAIRRTKKRNKGQVFMLQNTNLIHMVIKRVLSLCALLTLSIALGLSENAIAADEAADAFIKRLSIELQDLVKNDPSLRAGDLQKTSAVVDTKIMPHLNFQRMTASAVGPAWRTATPEQQAKLIQEFKLLLIRTYAGALSQVSDLTINVKPLRGSLDDNEVLVRSEIKGKGEAIQLDYRLERTSGNGSGWKIYNLNVLGVWLVETYRSQFSQEINAHGLDGLINTLVERNKANAKK
jgi:phospholipid transport system substrate-binding protein